MAVGCVLIAQCERLLRGSLQLDVNLLETRNRWCGDVCPLLGFVDGDEGLNAAAGTILAK